MHLDEDQKAAVTWIKNAFFSYKGVILADMMGKGKTAPAIDLVKEATKTAPVLIIYPAYLVQNWIDELIMWGADVSRLCVIDSTKQILTDSDIYMSSYDTVRSTEIMKQLLKKKFSLMVCDEAHYLKAWNSLRSNRILGTYKNKQSNLLARTSRALLLTGTPILKNIEDLYNVVVRIAPEVMAEYSRDEFYRAFVGKIIKTPWKDKIIGVKNVDALRKLLSPVLLRRTFIPDLPEIEHKEIKLKTDCPAVKKAIADEMQLLKQLHIDPKNLSSIDDDCKEARLLSEVRQKSALLKIPSTFALIKDLRENESGPILFFCYHKSVLTAITNGLKIKFPKLKTAGIHGGIPVKKRVETVSSFKKGEIDILCATMDCLKEGENVTIGHTIIFVERSWSPAVMKQAIGRVYRRGQTEDVTVYYFDFTKGIDALIRSVGADKIRVMTAVLD